MPVIHCGDCPFRSNNWIADCENYQQMIDIILWTSTDVLTTNADRVRAIII